MATLNISDLSVGDWVLMNGEPAKALRLTMVGRTIFKGLSGQIYGSLGDDISPLPLTPEILEANGWKKGQRGEFYHYLRLDKNSTLYVHASTNGWRVEITYDAAGILRTTHLMPDVVSIHQLQHALRLAGVDKEIVMPKK